MKKLLFMMTISCLALFSCGGPSEAEKEKQDSLEAAAQADSMLKAEIAADSLKGLADPASKMAPVK